MGGNVLRLRPVARDYTCILTGTTRCEGKPCPAQLDLKIEADGDNLSRHTLHSTENGRFWLEVLFQALPHQQMDWTLSSTRQDSRSAETRGRQILMDETSFTITADLDLK
jgi:hypothetical protein